LKYVGRDEDVSQLQVKYAENLMLVELKNRGLLRNHELFRSVAVVERIGLEVGREMGRCQRKLLQCEFVGQVVSAAGAEMGWA
jgi:hypothetical protein